MVGIRKPTCRVLNLGQEGGAPPSIIVKTSSNPRALDDPFQIMRPGRFRHITGGGGYSGGYLQIQKGALRSSLGTKMPVEMLGALPFAAATGYLAPTQRFDHAMFTGTGKQGKLAARYQRNGYRPDAAYWEGYCDRWAYSALDPKVAALVNTPRLYKGVYFSIAELRAFASYLGQDDEDISQGLYVRQPSGREILDGLLTLCSPGGPGFISNLHNRMQHLFKKQEVWNQPFVGGDFTVKELHNHTARAAALRNFHRPKFGSRVWTVEVDALYLSEARHAQPQMDDHEGPPLHGTRHYKFYVLTDAQGNMRDVNMSWSSEERIADLKVPARSGVYRTAEGKFFFTQLLPKSAPLEQVRQFERHLQELAAFRAQNPLQPFVVPDWFIPTYRGIRNAYPDAELAVKLAPFGLSVEHFS